MKYEHVMVEDQSTDEIHDKSDVFHRNKMQTIFIVLVS